jgi:hypothetical protein
VHRRWLWLGVALGLLAGCDRQTEPVGGDGPAFDPVAFFSGHVRSHGVVETRSGTPTEEVVTDCQGAIGTDGRLHMTQHLTFQDGEKQERAWIMWRDGPGAFRATANDMAGTADGRSTGWMFHWRWVLERSPVNVDMEQWMYRMPDGSVLIRTTIGKLGVILAEVTEQFVRDGAASGATSPRS